MSMPVAISASPFATCTRLISLGRHCQTAFQIRRYTGDTTTFFFDWARTLFPDLLHILRSNFAESLDLSNLELAEGDTVVRDRATGLLYRHLFSHNPVTDRIEAETIPHEFAMRRAKHDFLVDRWRSVVQEETILFIRHDELDPEEIDDLYATLIACTGKSSFLLVLSPAHNPIAPARDGILVRGGFPIPSGHDNWKGLDLLWDKLFTQLVPHLCNPAITPRPPAPTSFFPPSLTGSFPRRHVLFLPLPEAGHILPTLGMASWLVQEGCRVTYLCSPEYQAAVSATGANLFTLEDLRRGSFPDQPAPSPWNRSNPRAYAERLRHFLAGPAFTDLLREHAVEALAIDLRLPGSSFSFSANTPPRIYYATSLPNWDEDLSHSLNGNPLLILCPSALEVVKFRKHQVNVHFVEPSLRPATTEVSQPNFSSTIDPRPLVLVSFGTQSIRYPRLPLQLQLLYELAQASPHLRFVVSANIPDLATSVPENMSVSTFVPQRALLREARVLISHGGLGSVKEAIFAGVPLVVLPAIYDQPFNAMRVRIHNLGSAIYPEHQTVPNLRAAIEHALSGAHDAALGSMRHHFRELEANAPSRPLLRRFLENTSALPSKGSAKHNVLR